MEEKYLPISLVTCMLIFLKNNAKCTYFHPKLCLRGQKMYLVNNVLENQIWAVPLLKPLCGRSFQIKLSSKIQDLARDILWLFHTWDLSGRLGREIIKLGGEQTPNVWNVRPFQFIFIWLRNVIDSDCSVVVVCCTPEWLSGYISWGYRPMEGYHLAQSKAHIVRNWLLNELRSGNILSHPQSQSNKPV